MSKKLGANDTTYNRADIGHIRKIMVMRKITVELIYASVLISIFAPVKVSLAASKIDYQSLQENPIDTAFRRILTQEVPDWDEGDITSGAISDELKGIEWPLKIGKMTSVFSLCASNGRRRHTGVDLLAPKDTPIHAVLDGVVEVVSNGGMGWRGYGRVVFINHGGKFWSLYSHCNQLKVKIGQKVKKGEVIATVGATGRASGYHLHFELRNSSGIPIDPMRYLPKDGMLSVR